MMESEDFISNISFEFENEKGYLVFFDGQGKPFLPSVGKNNSKKITQGFNKITT